VSWRDIILIGGGLFLLAKATHEIHGSLEGEDEGEAGLGKAATAGFVATIIQIGILDIVFSLDSVITAVGMVNNIPIMVAAILVALLTTTLAGRTGTGVTLARLIGYGIVVAAIARVVSDDKDDVGGEGGNGGDAGPDEQIELGASE